MFKMTSQKSLHPKQPSSAFYKDTTTALSAKSYDLINPQSATNLDNYHSQSTVQSKMGNIKSSFGFNSSKNKNNKQGRKSSLKELASNQTCNYKIIGSNQGDMDESIQNFTTVQSEKQFSIPIFFQIEGESEKDKFQYYYNSTTKCQQFYEFLLQKVIEKQQKMNIYSKLTLERARLLYYFKSGNMHIDYFITLRQQQFILINSITDKVHIKVHKLNKLSIGFNLKIFQIIKCIGSGGFSKVFLARAYGIMMAIKVIQKELITQNSKKTIIENQNQILQACSNHPFVTKLYLSFETNKYIVFGLQYCNGGQLFNLLRKVKRMKEDQAKFYFLETLSVIAFLHSKNILYRDLKPQNIILDYQGHIRLADYGLSKMLRDGKTYSFCGSAEYMAPQMLLKTGHSFEVDYYCLGALLYQLVTGLPPYYSRNQNQLFSNILNNKLAFPQNPKWPLSKPLKEFLSKLLNKNTADRFHSVQQMFQYQWLKGTTLTEVIRKQLKPPFKLDVLDYNFDDSQFAQDQQREMRRLQLQRQYGQVKQADQIMQNFLYQNSQIRKIRQQIQNLDSHGLKKQKLQRHTKKMTENMHHLQIGESNRKYSNQQSSKFLNKYLSKFIHTQPRKDVYNYNENQSKQMTTVSQLEEKTQEKKIDSSKNSNVSIPQRISYVKGVLSGINQAKSLEMLKNYSPNMHHLKNTQNNIKFQEKSKNEPIKINKNFQLTSSVHPNIYSGNSNNNPLNYPYSPNNLTYSQNRNYYQQSSTPTHQYVGIVNNQPYQQFSYEKKPYMQSAKNFSMTENKNSQPANVMQKTIMFNKSKEKMIGDTNKSHTLKTQNNNAVMQGFQYNPSHNYYSSKLSGDIKQKNRFNFFGSPAAKSYQQ